MKKKVVWICLLIIGALILSFGIWCFIVGLLNEGGNINYIIGPFVGALSIFVSFGLIIPSLVFLFKKSN